MNDYENEESLDNLIKTTKENIIRTIKKEDKDSFGNYSKIKDINTAEMSEETKELLVEKVSEIRKTKPKTFLEKLLNIFK